MHGVAVVVACFALVALLLAWSRWLAGRRLAAAGHVAMAIAAAAVALLMWSVTAGLESYEPVLRDQPIASLYVERTGPQRFRATLTRLPAGRVQVFELTGDQWRVEARTLDWHGLAAQIGLDRMYRLERLSTRANASALGSGNRRLEFQPRYGRPERPVGQGPDESGLDAPRPRRPRGRAMAAAGQRGPFHDMAGRGGPAGGTRPTRPPRQP